MKPKKKKISKTTITIIITILSSLILGCVFFGTYYFFTDKSLNQYEKSIKQIVNTVNSINKNTKGFVKEHVIDPEASKKGLSRTISDLENVKKKIESLVPGDKYKTQHSIFLEGLNNNILMYRQLLNILQNPNSKDIGESFDDYKNFKIECDNYYSQFSVGGILLSSLNEADTFLKSFEYYCNELIKIQRDTDIRVSQTLDFITKLDNINSNFIPLKTDYYLELEKARKGEITFEAVIELAMSYQEKNNKLEKELHGISVPQNCKVLKDSLAKIFDEYDLYIQSFTLAVSQEKTELETQGLSQQEQQQTDTDQSQKRQLDASRLKDIYYDSNNSFLSIQDKYDNFSKLLTEFKTLNLK